MPLLDTSHLLGLIQKDKKSPEIQNTCINLGIINIFQ